jgi:hypothetical protein
MAVTTHFHVFICPIIFEGLRIAGRTVLDLRRGVRSGNDSDRGKSLLIWLTISTASNFVLLGGKI